MSSWRESDPRMTVIQRRQGEHQAPLLCAADSCQASASASGMPVPMCASHLRATYEYAQGLVNERWQDALDSEIDRQRTVERVVRGNTEASWVYFIRCGDLIKIGYTTNLTTRFRQLRPDEVLATTPGTMRDETRCHAAFKHLREHGEYFRPGADLLEFIDAVAKRPAAA